MIEKVAGGAVPPDGYGSARMRRVIRMPVRLRRGSKKHLQRGKNNGREKNNGTGRNEKTDVGSVGGADAER